LEGMGSSPYVHIHNTVTAVSDSYTGNRGEKESRDRVGLRL